MDTSVKLIHQAERYLAEKAYRIQKEEFLPKTTVTNRKEDEKKRQLFAKGDWIFVNEYQKGALVYEDIGEDTVDVYLDKKIICMPRQRAHLVHSVEDLHPTGYDLDDLFIDYKIHGQQCNLEQGSKKVHKVLVEEMYKRQEEGGVSDENSK